MSILFNTLAGRRPSRTGSRRLAVLCLLAVSVLFSTAVISQSQAGEFTAEWGQGPYTMSPLEQYNLTIEVDEDFTVDGLRLDLNLFAYIVNSVDVVIFSPSGTRVRALWNNCNTRPITFGRRGYPEVAIGDGSDVTANGSTPASYSFADNGLPNLDDICTALRPSVSSNQGSWGQLPPDTYAPWEPLSVFDGENARGTWTIRFKEWLNGETYLKAAGPQILPQIHEVGLTFTTPVADLTVALSADMDEAIAGQTINYTVDVSNSGDLAADNTVAVLSLPSGATGLTFVSTSGCSEDPNGVATCSLGSLAPGGTAQYTVQALVNGEAEGEIPASVTVSTTSIEADTSNNTATLGFEATLTSAEVIAKTQRLIRNFMSKRADRITADRLDLADRLRGELQGTGGNPLGYWAQGTPDNLTTGFATSLGYLTRTLSDEKPQSLLGYDSIEDAAGTSSSGRTNRFDVWTKGTYSRVNSAGSESDAFIGYIGADYLITPDLVVGLIAQFDHMTDKDPAANTSVEGWGWLAGPYVAARLHQNLIFDARAQWGQSYNSVDPLGLYSDRFNTERWMIRAELTGDFHYGSWLFAPFVEVVQFAEQQKTYTDSLGNLIGSQQISLGRLIFGPELRYSHELANGIVLTPSVSIEGIWNYDPADYTSADGLIANSDDIRASARAGLNIQARGGWYINASGFYDGIGTSDLEAYGGNIKLVVPFN